MSEEEKVKISVYIPRELYEKLEETRASKRPIPSLSEAVRELLEKALKEAGK